MGNGVSKNFSGNRIINMPGNEIIGGNDIKVDMLTKLHGEACRNLRVAESEIRSCLGIVEFLEESIKGGEVGDNLLKLYCFVDDRLKGLGEAFSILSELYQAWVAISDRDKGKMN